MARTMFRFQVRPEMLAEYRQAHNPVWPDMLRALRDTGWNNYSLFTGPDGLVIGYVEADDIHASRAAIAKLAANAQWQAAMSHYFSSVGPDESWVQLDEAFNLEDQLAALGE